MSLCPRYCDCRTCKHGAKLCDFCDKCAAQFERDRRQNIHEESVRKQKSRLRKLKES